MRKKTVGIAGALALAGTVVLAGPAFADPKPGPETVRLTCDGVTYPMTINGNGDYTPAHITGSTRVFIPVAFGESTFTIYEPDGVTVLAGSFVDPAKAKNGKHVGQTCSYEGRFVGFDPEVGQDVVEVFSGTVDVKIKKA